MKFLFLVLLTLVVLVTVPTSAAGSVKRRRGFFSAKSILIYDDSGKSAKELKKEKGLAFLGDPSIWWNVGAVLHHLSFTYIIPAKSGAAMLTKLKEKCKELKKDGNYLNEVHIWSHGSPSAFYIDSATYHLSATDAFFKTINDECPRKNGDGPITIFIRACNVCQHDADVAKLKALTKALNFRIGCFTEVIHVTQQWLRVATPTHYYDYKKSLRGVVTAVNNRPIQLYHP